MRAQAKTINLLLYDGSLQGVISIEDSSWNSGELYSAPRESVEDLLETDACSKYGVYLLLSSDKVYVGQSSDLARRLAQHLSGKDWWESVVILTTKDDSLNHADIDYLESVLIEKAGMAEKLDCDNGNRGNPRKVDRFRKVFLGQYLDEALFLMQLIGITVFSEDDATRRSDVDGPARLVINTQDARIRLKLGTRAKSYAIEFLKEHGVDPGKNVSYSTLRSNGSEFWLNPQATMLSGDWCIILNDTEKEQITAISLPAHTLHMEDVAGRGLVARADKPHLLDLHISRDTLIDQSSGVNFSPFVQCRLSY